MKRSTIILILSVAWLGCTDRRTITPERRTIVDAVFASGHTENRSQYTIMANVEGLIQQAYVVEGDTVHSGQRLFRIQNNVQLTQVANAATNLDFARTNAAEGSPQLLQLEAQIAQAQKKLSVDSVNYLRYSRLVKTQAVSTSDYDNARLTYQNSQSALVVLEKNLADLRHNLNLNVDNARAQYEIQKENDKYYNVTSVGNGMVMNVNKKTGDYIKKGDAIAVMGTGSVIIKLDIAEDDIRRVRVGQRTLISLNSEKDKTYKAVITKIYPSFNSTEQSFVAEASFDTIPDDLLNGTQLQANIIIETRENALVIPSYCLMNDSFVLVKGNPEKRRVSVGIRTLEWAEITAGLQPGEAITAPKQQ
ncbi:MAG TPA: HlyD family efflux transporter periplasmic adaptor subunit [Puia sp.]|nr:HlyD family efflux transporter periplasmic adaptor subunit [Puia sp.]